MTERPEDRLVAALREAWGPGLPPEWSIAEAMVAVVRAAREAIKVDARSRKEADAIFALATALSSLDSLADSEGKA